ncbi:MAG: peroxidase-related enzyme [Crocosphaera sp.]|nr:peroxidase-related enzyme [Crocosphaera sp.]
MKPVAPLNYSQASVEAQAVLREIEKGFGQIPNLFKTMAHFPPLLKANWEKYKAVMLKGNLSRQGKESLALLVSLDNGCHYCVAAHSQALLKLGLSPAQVQATVESKLTETGLQKKEIQLLSLARRANKNPHEIDESSFEDLKQLGVTEVEIIETLGVVELFVGFNKFVDTLKVEQDF